MQVVHLFGHWRASEIENGIIPMLDREIQIMITEKIQRYFALRQQSEKLAKRAVEIAIETDETAAMNFIATETKIC